MNDILNRLHVQCGSDLHDGFVRSLFSEAAVEIERLRRDAERYRWLREHFRFSNDSMRELWFDQALEPDDAGVPVDLDQQIDAAMNGANAQYTPDQVPTRSSACFEFQRNLKEI